MFEFSEDALNEICASLKKTKERQEREASIYRLQVISQTAMSVISAQAREKQTQLSSFANKLTSYAQEIEVKRKKFLEVSDKTKKAINTTNSLLREKSDLLSRTTASLMAIKVGQVVASSKNFQNANTTSAPTTSALTKFLKSVTKSNLEWLKETGAATGKTFVSGAVALIMGQNPEYVLVKSAVSLTIQNFKTSAKLVKNTTSALVEFGKEIIPKVGNAITGAVKTVGKVTKSIFNGIKNIAVGLYTGAKKAITGAKKVVDTITKSIVEGISAAGDIIVKGSGMATKILSKTGSIMSGVNMVVSVASTVASAAAIITGATPAGPIISIIATGLKTASTVLGLSTSVVTGAAKVTNCVSEVGNLIKTRIESGEKITLKTIGQDIVKVASSVGSAVIGASTAIISASKLTGAVGELTGVVKNLGDMASTAFKNVGTKLVEGGTKQLANVANIIGNIKNTGAKLVEGATKQISNVIGNIGNTAKNFIKDAGNKLAEDVAKKISNVANVVGNVKETAKNFVKDTGAKLVEGATKQIFNVANIVGNVKDTGAKLIEGATKQISNVANIVGNVKSTTTTIVKEVGSKVTEKVVEKVTNIAKDFVSTKTSNIKEVGSALATGAKKAAGFVCSLLGKK